jgi:hypothetical protein
MANQPRGAFLVSTCACSSIDLVIDEEEDEE